MIRGRTIKVLSPVVEGYDRFKEPVYGFTGADVDNVLISPGATADLEASRPDGVTVDLTLHFPKGYTGDLRGCDVQIQGEYGGRYHVIGEPKPYLVENTPTPWVMPVEVERCDG